MPYPYPVLFTIGPFSVFTYGLFMFVAFVLALWLALHRRKDVGEEHIYNISIISIIAGIVGARIAFFIFAPQHLQSFYDFIAIWQGGMSWFGGFFLALIAVFFYVRKKKLSYAKILDVFAPCLPLAIAITRIGAFISGANPGLPTEVPWAIMYNGIMTHPAALYHAFANFLIFFALIFVAKKTKLPGKFASGYLFLIFTLLFGVERFINDFFRAYDSSATILAARIVPLLLIAVSLILLVRIRRRG